MALPKSNRLSLRTSKDLFLGGRRYSSVHFSLTQASTSPDQSLKTTVPQFAVVVSKKTARLSHDRHRIRRQTTSAIFEQLNDFPVGYYLVFPKKTLLNTALSELVSDFSKIIHKLKK